MLIQRHVRNVLYIQRVAEMVRLVTGLRTASVISGATSGATSGVISGVISGRSSTSWSPSARESWRGPPVDCEVVAADGKQEKDCI